MEDNFKLDGMNNLCFWIVVMANYYKSTNFRNIQSEELAIYACFVLMIWTFPAQTSIISMRKRIEMHFDVWRGSPLAGLVKL